MLCTDMSIQSRVRKIVFSTPANKVSIQIIIISGSSLIGLLDLLLFLFIFIFLNNLFTLHNHILLFYL